MDYALFDTMCRNNLTAAAAAKKLKVSFKNVEASAKDGEAIYSSIPNNAPKTSILMDIVFDFYKNYKTDFEIDCFLAFAALRSILQTKPYAKCTNAYLLARMAGNAGVDAPLPEWVRKYQHRYHVDKIKKELQINWGLKLYADHVRGFYVSFSMELTDLVFQAEKRRKNYKLKSLVNAKKQAKNEAKKRLYANST